VRGHWRDAIDVWFGRHTAGLLRLLAIFLIVGWTVKAVHG
jgi:hypothetical protein